MLSEASPVERYGIHWRVLVKDVIVSQSCRGWDWKYPETEPAPDKKNDLTDTNYVFLAGVPPVSPVSTSQLLTVGTGGTL